MNTPKLTVNDIVLIDEATFQRLDSYFASVVEADEENAKDIWGFPYEIISPTEGGRFVRVVGCADFYKDNKLIQYRPYVIEEVDMDVYLDSQ